MHREGYRQPANITALIKLQHHAGNQAVQRLLLQRRDDGPFELDEDTAGRIGRERGGGQALDGPVQSQMAGALGWDFSGVRVHTTPVADQLSRQLSAVAFTTGTDIFFRSGAYQPQTGGGQGLLAHELAHVVQQSSGRVGSSGGGMTVHAPGDVYEQEADAVARSVTSRDLTGAGPEANPALQREMVPEDEDLQMSAAPSTEMDEEDELPG